MAKVSGPGQFGVYWVQTFGQRPVAAAPTAPTASTPAFQPLSSAPTTQVASPGASQPLSAIPPLPANFGTATGALPPLSVNAGIPPLSADFGLPPLPDDFGTLPVEVYDFSAWGAAPPLPVEQWSGDSSATIPGLVPVIPGLVPVQ